MSDFPILGLRSDPSPAEQTRAERDAHGATEAQRRDDQTLSSAYSIAGNSLWSGGPSDMTRLLDEVTQYIPAGDRALWQTMLNQPETREQATRELRDLLRINRKSKSPFPGVSR